ncbi:MAG: hypothetical protein LBK61_07375 [Spirochaetaceae bacterium]|nr:hypothetical protein [Spirochaetaceae bacterium]
MSLNGLSPVSWENSPCGVPCGGENPAGFSSLCETCPRFWPRNQRLAGRAPPYGGVPLRSALRGRKPCRVFIPLRNLPPILAESQRRAGRAPPYGGCASPSGAQCRHKGVLCLPGTMLDWGEDEYEIV